MRKRVIILGILLVFCLCGCSETTGAINKEKTKEVADQMTDFLLDNTAFPNPNSKEEIKSIINGATDVVIESADSTVDNTMASVTENKSVSQWQIKNLDTPENYTEIEIPEWMLDSVLAESVKQGCTVEKQENSDNLYFIQNIEKKTNYILKVIEENE